MNVIRIRVCPNRKPLIFHLISRAAMAIAAALALLTAAVPARAATNYVKMVNFAFQPKFLTNAPGDTIIWTNTTLSGHNVVSSNNAWAAPALFTSPGTFQVTLSTPGTYGYYCAPHHSFGMTGIIYVQAPSQQPPVVSIAHANSGAPDSLVLSTEVTPGSKYELSSSSNLSDWLVFTNFTATQPVMSVSIPTGATDHRFFRARLVPSP